jgi:four helix bundle protein
MIESKVFLNYQFSFEKLDVWQLSINFIKEVYKVTNEFPESEKYGLVSQINRASVSVASNLAEGSSRTSPKDQAHFSQLAYSSLMEVICQLVISRELEYINEKKHLKLRISAEELSNKINALRNYQLNNYKSQQINNSTNKRLNK